MFSSDVTSHLAAMQRCPKLATEGSNNRTLREIAGQVA